MNAGTARFAATIGLLTLPYGLEGQQQALPFRAGVDLVTLDVRVLDRQGRPIRGLRPDEFQVEIDGERRPVQAIEFVEFGIGKTTMPGPSAPAPTFQSPRSDEMGRSILIAFDDLSFQRLEGRSTAQEAGRWLSKLDPRDRVGVGTTSGLGPPLAWTTDRTTTLRSIGELAGRRDRTPPGSLRVIVTIEDARAIRDCVVTFVGGLPHLEGCDNRGQMVLERECLDPGMLDQTGCAHALIAEAMRVREEANREAELQIGGLTDLLRALAAAPAPRILVLISRGLALTHPIELTAFTRVAGDAGVTVFALATASPGSDADLPVKLSDFGLKPADAKRHDDRFNLTGIETVASVAGGQSQMVVGSADRFLDRILLETSGYYRLGVELPTSRRDWLVLEVSARRSGASVHAARRVGKPGAVAETAAVNPVSVEDRLTDVLRRGGFVRGMAVDLATTLGREPTGQRLQITANVRLREERPGPLQAMFVVVADGGAIVTSGRLTLVARHTQPGFRAAFHVPVLPGRYRLRIAVADAEGAIGATERDLVARLTRIGSYHASDLVAAWAGTDGLLQYPEIDEVPSAAVTLRPVLELYAADGKRTAVPRVRLIVESPGGGAPMVTRDMDISTGGTIARASAVVLVTDLPPGEYTLHAVVYEQEKESGRVSTTVRIAARPR